MIRIKVLIFALLFAILGSPIAAIASDITNALYFGTIIVSNNSTATNNVATTGNISTPNLIAGQYLNATANNCAVQNSSGADVRFMPGYTDANLWCFWVPSIGADSYLTYLFYTANSTGGEIRYFPAAGGMSTSDDVTMEWGDDFESAFTNILPDTTGNLELLKKRYSANIQNYEGGLLAGMYFFEPVDVTPGVAGAWVDVDVSRYIPAGATGVLLEHEDNAANAGYRKNGSTDNRFTTMDHDWVMIGVDSDLIFEAYITAGAVVHLFGYTDDSWTLNTNANDVSLVPVGAWTDVDISTEAPNATAAIIEVNNTGAQQAVGLRKNNSADGRNGSMRANAHYFAVVGLDDDQIFDGWINAVTQDYYLIGYCTAGGTFDTNLTDKSLAGIGAWTDIDCAADAPDADFLLFEVYEVPIAGANFGFRAHDSTHTALDLVLGHSFAIVPCDDDQIVQGYITNVNVDFFLIGYITSGAEQPYQTHALAAAVSAAEHDIEVAIEAEPDMSLWASDVTISVSMGQGILPVKILEEITLTAPAASVTFSGITGNVSLWDSLAGVTSRHLVVMVNAKSPDAVAQRDVQLQFNADAGNNYNYNYVEGENAVTSSVVSSNVANIAVFPITGTTYANAFVGGVVLIPHAFNTSNHKLVLAKGGAAEDEVEIVEGRWASNNAVTSILLQPSAGNFDTGSTFLLGVIDERYLVEEVNLAVAGTIDFNNIPQNGDDLVIVGYARSSRAAVNDAIYHRINADAVAGNYFWQRLGNVGGGVVAAQGNNFEIALGSADTATANVFTSLVASYSQYVEGTNDPHYFIVSGWHENSGPTYYVRVYSGRRNNVVAITRLEYYPQIGPNFLAGSLFSLYRVPRYVIDRQELTGNAATITFANIPQNYQALQLNVYARGNVAALTDTVSIEINGDNVDANFDNQELEGTGAGPPTATRISGAAGSRVLMLIPAINEGANEFAGGIVTFPRYERTDGHKHFLTLSGTQENQVILRSSRWEDNSAITQIVLDLPGAQAFLPGSIFELVGLMPSEVFDITVDSEVKGLADGNFSAEDNTSDWIAGGFGTPYFESYEHTVSSVLRQQIEWRYNNIFEDLSGNSNNATPTFRSASSDLDVTANMTAFQPVSQAQAPAYVLGPGNPFITSTANITGNFTVVPPSGTFPLAGVITAVANATATPPQLPLLIIAIFVILAASLTTSYTLRRFGSGTLIVKSLVIIGIMGIFIALGDFGIDFWMLFVFSILAVAIAMMSRQITWR